MFSRFRMKVALFFHFLVLVEFSSQIPPQEARYAATLLCEQCPRHWIIAHKIKIYIMNTTSIFWVIFYKLYFCTWLSLSALLLFFKKIVLPLYFQGSKVYKGFSVGYPLYNSHLKIFFYSLFWFISSHLCIKWQTSWLLTFKKSQSFKRKP